MDASPSTDEDVVVGEYDFVALVARIAHAVAAIGATRVVLDSIEAVFSRFSDPGAVRRELVRVAAGLKGPRGHRRGHR